MRAVEQAAVLNSVANLMSFRWIAEKVAAGTLKLHGWWFNMNEGQLYAFNPTPPYSSRAGRRGHADGDKGTALSAIGPNACSPRSRAKSRTFAIQADRRPPGPLINHDAGLEARGPLKATSPTIRAAPPLDRGIPSYRYRSPQTGAVGALDGVDRQSGLQSGRQGRNTQTYFTAFLLRPLLRAPADVFHRQGSGIFPGALGSLSRDDRGRQLPLAQHARISGDLERFASLPEPSDAASAIRISRPLTISLPGTRARRSRRSGSRRHRWRWRRPLPYYLPRLGGIARRRGGRRPPQGVQPVGLLPQRGLEAARASAAMPSRAACRHRSRAGRAGPG